MRLSTVGRYALRAMIDLVQHRGEGPVQRKDIADRQEISNDYLAQLFGRLKRARLVQSVRGPGGGYILAQSPAEITAGDVLRAVDESLSPVDCINEDQVETCHRAGDCPTRMLWIQLGQAVAEVLDSTTLAELSAKPGRLVEALADEK